MRKCTLLSKLALSLRIEFAGGVGIIGGGGLLAPVAVFVFGFAHGCYCFLWYSRLAFYCERCGCGWGCMLLVLVLRGDADQTSIPT